LGVFIPRWSAWTGSRETGVHPVFVWRDGEGESRRVRQPDGDHLTENGVMDPKRL
jgi:hypothetical protein